MFNTYFYHRLTRKFIILFGNVFNNITVKRMNADFTTEVERIKVPILWAAKEKYIQKIGNHSETPKVQTVLPRMSYELVGMTYDSTRKLQNLTKYATLNTANNSVAWMAYTAAPYNLDFKLNIHARNIDDLGQIIEQILPYFQPDFTPTANILDNLRIPKDIKIVLKSIDPTFGYEGEMADATRDIECTMLFTLLGYYWGPVTSEKLITRMVVNVHSEDRNPMQIFNLGTGNGTYSMDDTVYQGNSAAFAIASGHVFQFLDANNKQLFVDSIEGKFLVNVAIKSTTTNASYILSSYEFSEMPAAIFTVTPNPLTANADSNFGLTIEIDTNE